MTGFEPAASWSQTRRSSQAEPHPVASASFCSRTTLDYYIKNILFCQQGFSVFHNLFEGLFEGLFRGSSDGLYRSPIDRRRAFIFIEKRRSCPASQQDAAHLSISRSDRQCFSHEDECPAPVTHNKNSLSELLPYLNQHVSHSRIKQRYVHRINTLDKEHPQIIIGSTYTKIVFFRINTIFDFLVKY